MRGRIALQSTSCEITETLFGFAEARHETRPSEWRTFGVSTRPPRRFWLRLRLQAHKSCTVVTAYRKPRRS